MKNFVLISPHFPSSYYHFAKSLKANGFRVLGIGDAHFSEILPELKDALTEYVQCTNMDSFQNEVNSVRYLEKKYGHIDYLESNNEYWLSRDAELRKIFNITTGIWPDVLSTYQHKSLMKKYYEKAGAKVAKYIIVKDYESTKKFVEKVGFPVFAKPDIGVGADETYKIQNIEDLQSFFEKKSPEITFICEQMLTGIIVSFDGVADENSDVVFYTGHVFPPSVADIKNEGLDCFYYCRPELPKELIEIGKKVIKAFGLKNRFFHCEYFQIDKDIPGVGKKGDFVGLEVNIRTPGGYTPDLINYCNSVDCYQIYADTIAFGKASFNQSPKFYAGCAARRDGFNYFYSKEDIFRTFKKELCQTGRYPDVFSDIMGNDYFMAKFNTLEEMLVFKDYVSKRSPDHIEKASPKEKKNKNLNICDTHIDGA